MLMFHSRRPDLFQQLTPFQLEQKDEVSSRQEPFLALQTVFRLGEEASADQRLSQRQWILHRCL